MGVGVEKKKRNREVCFECMFLFSVFIFYLLWAWNQPYNVSPDEYMRYQVVEYIYTYGKLPAGNDPLIINPLWGISYAFNPMLSYIFSAGFAKVASFFYSDSAYWLLAARVAGVLWGTGAAFFTERTARRLLKNPTAYFMAALVVFLPQAVFICSYINTDASAMFACAMIVFFWVRSLDQGWTYKNCIGLGVGISICALSYYNAYGFILCSIFLFAFSILLCGEKKWDFKELIKKGLVVTAVVAVLAGWWFVRNYIIYDGDFLGRNASSLCAELNAMDGYKPSQHGTPQKLGYSFWELWKLKLNLPDYPYRWITFMFMSFIGVFGYMSDFLPMGLYYVYLVLFLIGAAGCLLGIKELFAIREDKKWRVKGFFHWCMAAALIIPNFLNMYYSYTSDYSPQGRYSMPMLIPLMYFTAFGFSKWMEKFVKNPRAQKIITMVLCVLVVGIALYAFFGVFYPLYGGRHVFE